ncbi:hypothetical protein [Saccharopolyspora sp. ASAGF58]|uniref:hypothetical protein n=1 Tax=Saccharopolyspora TaxID=1835 RepID=UPI001444F896|nr:hypothetical protein [Saccharopolyspora sp. ASAGF58]
MAAGSSAVHLVTVVEKVVVPALASPLALAAGAFWVSRRNPINATNVNEVPVS